jgi:hypothetical protein
MAIVTINVSLNTSPQPGSAAVELNLPGGGSGRDVITSANNYIKWLRVGSGNNFAIVYLEPTDGNNALKDYETGNSGQWLVAKYVPSGPDDVTEYTLWVRSGGQYYSTTIATTGPTDDLPVIRN